MIYLLAVTTRRNLDLTQTSRQELMMVVRRCVAGRSHAMSQELAAIRIGEGIESVVFPSATGAGRNVVVYLESATEGSIVVRNRDEVLKALRRPRVRRE